MSRTTVGRITQLTHTPGPWEAEYLYDGGKTIAQIRSPKTLLCVNAALHPLLDERGELKSAEQLEAESLRNAHLIAAAPDLLAALKRAVETIRTFHGIGLGPAEELTWQLYQQSPEMKAINAAIAKAEGKC